MFRNKMKVIGSVVLALAFMVGELALSATNGVFAAGQSSKPGSSAPQIGGRVSGWCNWDNDQDKDDWCWEGTTTGTNAPSGSNVYAMPNPSGTVTSTIPLTTTTSPTTTTPAATVVVPSGSTNGQTDPYLDRYGYGNNGSFGYNSNMYDPFYYLDRKHRVVPKGRIITNGPPPRIFHRQEVIIKRNFPPYRILRRGKVWVVMPNTLPPYWWLVK